MPKFIFLDVDGVLVLRRSLLGDYPDVDDPDYPDPELVYPRNDEVGCPPIEKKMLLNLQQLLVSIESKLVLTSTWRLADDFRKYLARVLDIYGITIHADAPSLASSGQGRGDEIVLWLNQYYASSSLDEHKQDGEQNGYYLCILEDSDVHIQNMTQVGLKDHIVRTTMDAGLDNQHTVYAADILKSVMFTGFV